MPAVSHDAWERHQVWWYLSALFLGAGAGLTWPASSESFEGVVWPTPALLLYATFTQMSLAAVPRSLKDPSFLIAALVGNFVLMPAVVFGIVAFLPSEDALVLGLLLVLLAPCTDWFITFTSLGGGEPERASALAPLALLAQLGLLPLYLLLFTDFDFGGVFDLGAVWPAVLVLAAPLLAAVLTEAGSRKHNRLAEFRAAAGWFPVPLLTVVVFCVAASHIGPLSQNLGLVRWVALAAGVFLVSALVMAKLISWTARLPQRQGRTLAFALGTRNSFIVLPFALSLPPGWEIAAVVIVIQSVIELLGMIAYLRFVPRVLFPAH